MSLIGRYSFEKKEQMHKDILQMEYLINLMIKSANIELVFKIFLYTLGEVL